MSDSTLQFGPYKERVTRAFLADVDEFLSRDRRWGEISLLKAAGMDHRFLARLRKGESFRIDSLDDLVTAMNKAISGDLQPDAFRNIRKPAA